jgi:hypothetical protein
MTKITPHFSFEEMIVTDHSEFQKGVKLYAKENLEKLEMLCWHLEAIRAILKSPLSITSAVRTKELTQAIGGSKTSQHIKIEAADFVPMKKKAQDAFEEIKESGYPFGQLILEKRYLGFIIHIGTGTKRQCLYSPEQGKYEAYKEGKKYA